MTRHVVIMSEGSGEYYIRCSPPKDIPITNTRTHSCGEEAQLSLGWVSIGSELSSLNLNLSIRAE